MLHGCCTGLGPSGPLCCQASMRRKAPKVLSPSLLAEALETRIPRDAWNKPFANSNTYVLELVQEAKVIGRANKKMIQANYMIMEHLLSLNPTGIWKKTIMEDAFLLVDSKMGNKITHAKGGPSWATEEARMIMWLFMELKREKRNTKTSSRTPPWLATLFLMMDDDKVGDECDPEAMCGPAQMFYKRQQTLSSIAGSMCSPSGTSSTPRLPTVSLSSASGSSCKRPLMYRISDSPSKYLTTCSPTFYYDKVQEAAMMMVDGKVPAHLQPIDVTWWCNVGLSRNTCASCEQWWHYACVKVV